jgi:hypothetical protein
LKAVVEEHRLDRLADHHPLHASRDSRAERKVESISAGNRSAFRGVGPRAPSGAGLLEEPAPLQVNVPPLQAFLEQISLVGEADAEVGEGWARAGWR